MLARQAVPARTGRRPQPSRAAGRDDLIMHVTPLSMTVRQLTNAEPDLHLPHAPGGPRASDQGRTRRGVVRALYTSELTAIANVRRDALAVAEKQLDKLARLLPDALAAGLTLSEVSRLAEWADRLCTS